MQKYKKLIIIIISLCLISLLLYSTYKFSKSRTSQFVGEIVTHVETDEKVVALTFDDGPTDKTPEILEVLDESNIKATFFLTGKEIEYNKEYALDIIEKGHQVGNHSYSHQRLMLKSKKFIEYEVDKTNKIIRDLGYDGEIYFRAPYCKKLFMLPIVLKKRDITHVTWNIEPDTYLNRQYPKEDIANYVLDNISPGSIVLMHIMYDNWDENIKALPLIVEKLHADGYKFVTLDELLEYKK